jgi:hypothetical protein
MFEQQKNLMNRFGGGGGMRAPMAAPAPMQQQRPGFLETTGTAIAGNEIMSAFKDPSAYADKLGFGTAGVDVAAADAATMAAPEAVMGATAAPMAELGAAGLTEAGAGLGAEAAMTAGMAEAGAAGAAGAGAMGTIGAAMPWVGAGLLAGKALGLFSEGGPVNYKMCGGKAKYRAEGGRSDEDDYRAAAEFYSNYYDRSNKPKYDNSPYRIGTPKTYLNELPRMDEKQIMTPAEYRAGGGPLYREEGGDTGGFWNYFKKSFEKPAWADYEEGWEYVTDSSNDRVKADPSFLKYAVYRPTSKTTWQDPGSVRKPAPVEDRSVNLNQEIARDIYGEYDEGEDMGDASYLAGNPAPYSVQTYPLERRGEIPMKSNMPPKGGPLLRKFGAPGIRREPEEFNRDLNEYSINRNNRLNPQPDDRSGIWEDLKGFFSSMGSSNGNDADVSNFNMGGRVGPLKSVKYKSAGGNVSEQNYYNPYGK